MKNIPLLWDAQSAVLVLSREGYPLLNDIFKECHLSLYGQLKVFEEKDLLLKITEPFHKMRNYCVKYTKK